MEEYILTLINQTNTSLFLTGKAGTGKTTLLHKIINTTYKNTIVAAPTGIAALNAGGVTLHSLFQLPFASFLPTYTPPPTPQYQRFENQKSILAHSQMQQKKLQLIRNLELLIIDEVSMLRADTLDAINHILQHIRRNKQPFGGLQMLFIGDLLQLPPVVKQEEWNVLQHYYKGMYFFQSQVITQNPLLYIELEKIYRQTDPLFISILNHLRENKLTQQDIQFLNDHVKPNFTQKNKDKSYITLTTHNHKADTINQYEMQQLPSPPYTYQATVIDDFPEYIYPTEKTIQLKQGARVMFIKNDPSGEHLFFNGKMGTIVTLSENHIQVLPDDSQDPINVEQYVWENKRFKTNELTKDIEEEKLGTFTQYPLRLAWAITIHKSQGLTFDKAIIDINSVFASGQAYVAFSRLRSLSGLVLLSPIPQEGIDNDEEVITYAHNKATEKQVQQACQIGKNQYLQANIIKAFQWQPLLEEWIIHANSYNGEIGTKNIHKNWAQQQLHQIDHIHQIAQKFTKQLNTYFTGSNTIIQIFQRTQKAISYFIPLLSQVWYQVIYQILKIKQLKKVKEYTKELYELNDSLSETLKKLYKLQQIIQLLQEEKTLTKEEINNQALNEQYNQLFEKALQQIEKEQLFTEKTKPNQEDEKKEKPNTYDQTLQLWQEGKTITQIAQERKYTESTIYNHLQRLVTQGKLPPTIIQRILNQDEIQELTTFFNNQTENTTLKDFIQQTGDKYSYNQLHLFQACYKAAEEKQETTP